MAENMTRKSLAIGAASILAATMFTAAPANAAETLSLAPDSGTSYTVPNSSTFVLKAGFQGSESTEAQKTLKFRVLNPTGTTMTLSKSSDGTPGTVTDVVYGTSDDAAATATDVVVDNNQVDAIGKKTTLSVEVTEVAADYEIQVQAWLDLDDSNTIDSNEATSPLRTISFVDASNITLTPQIVTQTLGVTDVVVRVTSSPELNFQQMDANSVYVQGLKNTANSGTAVAAAYSSTFSDFRATVALGEAVTATATYGAVAKLTVLQNEGTTGALESAKVFGTVGSGQSTSLTTIDQVRGGTVSDDDNIRSGSGSFTVKTTATVNTGFSKAVPVTFKIAETGNSTLSAGASVTAGGVTLTNGSITTTEDVTTTVTANALGEALLTITYSGLKASDAIIVSATTPGTAAVVTATGDTFTAEDSLPQALVDDAYGHKQAVVGGSLSIGYTLVDQFGMTPEGTFRLSMSVSSVSNGATYSGYVNVANGAANFSATENSNSADDYNVVATLQKLQSDGTTYNATGANTVTETTAVASVASAAVNTITIAAANDGSSAALTRDELDAIGLDSAKTVESAAVPSYAGGTTLSGLVTGTGGAAVAGATITLSSPGLIFKSGTLYGNGSITISANASGQYSSVNIYTNRSGKFTITATSGGATASEEVTFKQANDDDGSGVALEAPSVVQPGSTATIKFTVTDKYGNAVITDSTATGFENGSTDPTVTVTYSGPGLRVGDLPSKTNASGQGEFSVLFGSNDSGTATVTVSYDKDGTGTTYAATSVSQTITVGSGTFSGTYGTVSAWTVDQGDGTAKVYVKFPTVGDKVRIGHQTGGSGSYETIYVKTTSGETMDGLRQVAGVGTYIVRTIDLASGTNRIRVDVGDDRLVQVRYND